MAKQYLINLLIKGLPDDIEFEIRENEWARIQATFDCAELFFEESRFVVFGTPYGCPAELHIEQIEALKQLPDSEFGSGNLTISTDMRSYLEAVLDNGDPRIVIPVPENIV